MRGACALRDQCRSEFAQNALRTTRTVRFFEKTRLHIVLSRHYFGEPSRWRTQMQWRRIQQGALRISHMRNVRSVALHRTLISGACLCLALGACKSDDDG